MRRVWFGLGLVLAGCPASSTTTRIHTRAAPPRTATDWERGVDGPRDYERALQVRLLACDRGAGDLRACDAAIEQIGEARGAAVDLGAIDAIVRGMCAHGDDIGCEWQRFFDRLWQVGEARVHGREPEPRTETAEDEARRRRIEAACEREQPRACRYLLASDLGWGDSSAEEERRDQRAAVACRDGHAPSCKRLLAYMTCDADEACERAQLAEWKAAGFYDDQLAAYAMLAKLCGEGDAVACDARGRPLADAALCAAKDYEACGNLGCLGDDDAAELARTHGVNPSCTQAQDRASRDWVASGVDIPPPLAADQDPTLAGGSLLGPFDVLVPRLHGGRDRLGWPRVDLYNLGVAPILAATVCVYVYDDDQRQVARVRQDVRGPIAPRAHVPLVLDHSPGAVPLGRNAELPVVTYDRIEVAGAPPTSDSTRCPAQRPFGQYRSWTAP